MRMIKGLLFLLKRFVNRVILKKKSHRTTLFKLLWMEKLISSHTLQRSKVRHRKQGHRKQSHRVLKHYHMRLKTWEFLVRVWRIQQVFLLSLIKHQTHQSHQPQKSHQAYQSHQMHQMHLRTVIVIVRLNMVRRTQMIC